MRGKLVLTDYQNCLALSNDFIFYIECNNYPFTHTLTTCLRADITIYDTNN